jgi:hypothetical protein
MIENLKDSIVSPKTKNPGYVTLKEPEAVPGC